MGRLPAWMRWRILLKVSSLEVGFWLFVLWWRKHRLTLFLAAVGDKTYIMYDSGIRGASDVVKALALGAKFVFVGRLWVWGLSIMGEHGVRHVMKSLLADLDILFNVAGIQSVDQIDKGWLESYPKSYSLIQERSKL
jgi:isopentenyl diphosphate isomerase/L-lactate dehydrogenase-like FMN-dependent dehydrogenase